VIVWDGAIGHFAASDAAAMLNKIKHALVPGGVFCGSESLGHEGRDHLQFFDAIDDLRRMLQPHFANVQLREESYPINQGTFMRREGYWRCSDGDERLRSAWTESNEPGRPFG
jgi:hypothetical protein